MGLYRDSGVVGYRKRKDKKVDNNRDRRVVGYIYCEG